MAVPALGTRHMEQAEVGVDLEPTGYPATFSLEPSSKVGPQRTQEGLGPDCDHWGPPAQYWACPCPAVGPGLGRERVACWGHS